MSDTLGEDKVPTTEDYALLGRVSDLGSSLDMRSSYLYAGLAGVSFHLTHITLSPITSVNARRSVLANIAYERFINPRLPPADGPARYAEVTKLLYDWGDFSSKRNKIVHGLWATEHNHQTGEAKLVRLYLGPSLEDMDHLTRNRDDGPKAQSRQDKAKFTSTDIANVVADGSSLLNRFHQFALTHFSHIFRDTGQPQG